jgi:NitT/TauT family transport system substrate-binding protein
VLITRPEIKSAEQLKGGTVGLSAFRGANPAATRFALQKLGLGPKDVSLLVVGGTSERIASLRLGKIHGTLFSPPQNITAQREGFNALADVAELGLPFVHIGVATTQNFIRDNPETLRRYVRSHLEAIALMKTDRELAVRTLGKYIGQIKERDVLVKSYESATPDNRLSRKQYPNLAGLQMALDLVAEDNPKAKSAKPEDFVDSRSSRNSTTKATSRIFTRTNHDRNLRRRGGLRLGFLWQRRIWAIAVIVTFCKQFDR